MVMCYALTYNNIYTKCCSMCYAVNCWLDANEHLTPSWVGSSVFQRSYANKMDLLYLDAKR